MTRLWMVLCFILASSLRAEATDCDEYVMSLAVHDIHLNYKKELANALVENKTTAEDFVTAVDATTKGGEKYACGFTRFWVDNIFQGTARQYEELRWFTSIPGYGPECGFRDVVGNSKLIELFGSYSGLKDNYVLYKFQIFGVADHVWSVLQTPGPKYKVYQSYNMAYSLYAWLASDISGMYSRDPPGHIRYWDDVFKTLQQAFASMGGQVFNNGTIIFPPNITEPMKQWALYIVNYDQAKIEANFKKAWDKFGQNRWLDKDMFVTNYVNVLQNLVDTMKTFVGTAKPWTEKLHDDWIGLFSSPNPAVYPGIPFNTLTSQMTQDLQLQVRVEIIPMMTNDCEENYMKLKTSITKSGSSRNFLMIPTVLMVMAAMFCI